MDSEDNFDPALFQQVCYDEEEFSFGETTVRIKVSHAASTDFELTGQV